MRKFIVAGCIIGAVGFLFNIYPSSQKKADLNTNQNVSPSAPYESDVDPVEITSESLFIPYWNVPSSAAEVAKYDELIYFGVTPTRDGSLDQDSGMRNVGSFIQNTSSAKKRLLTLRMLDAETNIMILEDEDIQDRVLRNTIQVVEQYGFDGVVLDLEMGVIPFEDTKEDISTFVGLFSSEASEKDVEISMTMYGDTFYRGRPYDVEALGALVDDIYIMAYDFHKSRGEPGPNFPFARRRLDEGGPEYPYDFQQMVADFSSVVPREKFTIIFGMYGYDWALGQQGLPLKAATAVPLNQIDEAGFTEDPVSHEKRITYTDDEGYKHVLWYEDEESVEVKTEYVQEQGIGSVGYWVWGYF